MSESVAMQRHRLGWLLISVTCVTATQHGDVSVQGSHCGPPGGSKVLENYLNPSLDGGYSEELTTSLKAGNTLGSRPCALPKAAQ